MKLLVCQRGSARAYMDFQMCLEAVRGGAVGQNCIAQAVVKLPQDQFRMLLQLILQL